MLERDQRKRPYPHTVRPLADALGIVGFEEAVAYALWEDEVLPPVPP